MIITMPNIAIAVVAYNRLDSVERLLNTLLSANYSQTVPLIISIDKSNTDSVEKISTLDYFSDFQR